MAKEKAHPAPKTKTMTLQEWLDDIRGPVAVKCACGVSFMSDVKCSATARHEAIRAEVESRFAKGDIVFYNKWAYGVNDKGVIVGYVKADHSNWGWVRVKFDRLKTSRAIPVYSIHGWHLSKHPLNFTEIGDLRYPDTGRGNEWAPRLA